MQAYGRMIEPANFKDHRAAGGNPCLEQTLESNEMCCLVETFPHNHDSYDDF
jgi:ribonucleoside-triphosphate reductase